MSVLTAPNRWGDAAVRKIVKLAMDRKQRSNLPGLISGCVSPDLQRCLKSYASIFLTIFTLLTLFPLGQLNAALSETTRQLFQAVDVNDIGAVKKAVANGADLNAKNTTGMSPADIAVDKGHFIIAHFLLSERGSRKTSSRESKIIPSINSANMAKNIKSAQQIKRTTQKPRNLSKDQKTVPIKRVPPKRKRVTKRDRFEMPPRKPSPKAPPIDTIIAVEPAPGVEVPDGSAPPESTHAKLPELSTNADEHLLKDDDLGIDEIEEAEVTSPDRKLGPVGTFFQNLVELVTPDGTPTSDQAAQVDQGEEPNQNKNPDAHLARELEDEPSIDDPSDVKIPEGVKISPAPPINETIAETPRVQEDETSLFDNLFGDQAPEPAAPTEESSATRTFDRIKGLLSPEDLEEDEFGLPIINDIESVQNETIEPDTKSSAVDSVLDQLDEISSESRLDDFPGPETGPLLEPILADDTRIKTAPVSAAMRNRLERMREALSRNVHVDTNAILQAGRKKYSDLIPEIIPAPSRARSDIAVDNEMTERKNLKPRQTPSARFGDRIKKIRKMENLKEDVYGLPLENPDRKKMPVATATATVEQPAAEPSTIDQIVDYFTGDRHRRTASASDDLGVPGYRTAPDNGIEPILGPDQPDIADLDTFDETNPDTTRITPSGPAQVRGNIPPEFLDRLAVLFNKDEQAKELGWQAKTTTPDGRPGGSTGGQSSLIETSWTTTSKLNVGTGRPMAILKVEQTTVPQMEPEKVITPSDKRHILAQAPYSDPLKSPKTKIADQKTVFFSRLTNLFQPKDRDGLPRESLLLEQDEKLSTRNDALKADVQVASRNPAEVRTYWPITELTTTDTLATSKQGRGAARRPGPRCPAFNLRSARL